MLFEKTYSWDRLYRRGRHLAARSTPRSFEHENQPDGHSSKLVAPLYVHQHTRRYCANSRMRMRPCEPTHAHLARNVLAHVPRLSPPRLGPGSLPFAICHSLTFSWLLRVRA